MHRQVSMVNLTAFCMKTASSPSSVSYQRLKRSLSASLILEMKDLEACESGFCLGGGLITSVSDFSVPPSGELTPSDLDADDTVVLKITMLGDCETRKTNFVTAIPVLIGTKFDHFIHLPRDIQLTIIKQARGYAHAMEAILFFSSVTHNINVHKIFKVITAKLFDLPCNIARNLTVGEPIIDY